MKKKVYQMTAFLLIGMMICTSVNVRVLAAEQSEASTLQDEIAETVPEESSDRPQGSEETDVPEEQAGETEEPSEEQMQNDTSEEQTQEPAAEDDSEEVSENTENDTQTEEGSEEMQPDGSSEGIEEEPSDASAQNTFENTLAVVPSITYKIVFDGNEAESGAVSELELTYGRQKTLPANAFLRTGYTFKGWNTQRDGNGTAYKNKAVVKNLTDEPNGIVTLYAQWKANKYTVVFNGKGKTAGAMQKMTKLEYGQTYTLPANTYRKKGCTFLGWIVVKNGTSIEYADGSEFSNLSAKNGATVTLNANWYEEPYTVNYQLDGGENDARNPNTYTVSSSIKLKKPTKCGYTFKGWYNTGEFKKKVSGISKGSIGNKTFYAKWALTQYQITYRIDGGKNSRANPSKYFVTSPAIILETPTKKGFDFEGWYTDAEYTNKIEQINEGSTGNLILYAKWSPIIYTISFEAGEATGTLPDPISCKYGKTYKLAWPDLVKTGYQFKGWYTEPNGTGTGYAPGKTVKNITTKNGANVTMYATWTKMTSTEEQYAKKVISLVNQKRTKAGKDALIVNPLLSAIAQERALELTKKFDHKRPDGSKWIDLFTAAGYQRLTAGENIAYGYIDPSDVMNGWMNSTGHKANILSDGFTEIGVGCYYYNGVYYWVQCFGTPCN